MEIAVSMNKATMLADIKNALPHQIWQELSQEHRNIAQAPVCDRRVISSVPCEFNGHHIDQIVAGILFMGHQRVAPNGWYLSLQQKGTTSHQGILVRNERLESGFDVEKFQQYFLDGFYGVDLVVRQTHDAVLDQIQKHYTC